MSKELLIERDPHQTRAAVLEDGRLTEIYLERHKSRGVVGNVYKGRVSRILPGMQAAFVDIGLERNAFLYVSDVRDALQSIDELAEADPQTAEFPVQELKPIEELLQQGQDLLVQVVKSPLPNKGARITTEITLPGRYGVLVPTVRSLGVSRRIREPEERDRLRETLESLDLGDHGLIVRTAGEGKNAEDFASDFRYLARLWELINQRAREVSAPSRVHQDQDLTVRSIRDRFGDDFSELIVSGEGVFDEARTFVEEVEPHLLERIRVFEGKDDLFDHYGIEAELEAALKSKVWLRSGGYIVIHPTEALVAIDVNTGRFVGRNNLEDTVFKTNLEAVQEIVRQIRLRDLSGIIVIDLIDMAEDEHKTEVFDALQEELKKDRAKNQVLNLSDFGLVEITRKRSRANLERHLTRSCPHCQGRGRILSIPTICLNLRRAILRRAGQFGSGTAELRVHPEILEALHSQEADVLAEIEQTLGTRLRIRGDSDLHPEHFDIVEIAVS